MDREPILEAVLGVTAKWTKQRKAEERDANRRWNRCHALIRRRRISIKEAAWDIMEDAYLRASAGGSLPAHARQVMYQARPGILERATDCGALDDAYFTQTLLPDYMAEHPEETESWDVVFDARGSLHEPHTQREIALGTLDVRDYLRRVDGHCIGEVASVMEGDSSFPTMGPENRYSAILFVEKEGFLPLFEHVRLAERYDVAIMSTKGMSNTAARRLVDTLCNRLPLLVAHDFDKAGFSILGTLSRDTRRFTFTRRVMVADLGLRLADIQRYGLQAERCVVLSDPSRNLRENGATAEEIAFLKAGQRVELNAFTSEQLVEWIEHKLEEHGVKKVVPDDATLDTAYRRAALHKRLRAELEDLSAELEQETASMKVDVTRLRREVEDRLSSDRAISWDAAVAGIVRTGSSSRRERSE